MSVPTDKDKENEKGTTIGSGITTIGSGIDKDKFKDKDKVKDKESLKMLRETRRYTIERARKAIQEHNAVIKAILKAMGPEGATVPQIAAAAGLDSARVLLFVSGLRKYGSVVEGPKQGDYFTYRPAQHKSAG